ncbi:branched-chain amino acid ABC transporter permease [Chloroflexota bacterium]
MTLNKGMLRTALPILIIMFTLPLYASSYSISLLTSILMYATLTVSWMILSGYTGYVSLGSAAFFGLGAYMPTLLWPMLPFPLLVLVGGATAGVFAFIIGIPVLRIRGPYFVILTFGLSQLLQQVFVLYESNVKGQVGTLLLNTPSQNTIYIALLAVCVGAIIAAQVIKNSKFGYGLFSIRGDEEAAEAMGVNTTRSKLFAFVISSTFMGFVGSIMALRWTFIDPPIAFNYLISFQVCIMSILGGWKNFRGPLLGAIVLTLISEAFGVKFPYYFMIILGVTLILLMKFLPDGLLDAIQRLQKKRRAIIDLTNR